MGLIERLFGRRRKAAELAVQDDHLLLRPARSRFRTVITIAVATSTDRIGRSTQEIAPYDRSPNTAIQPKRGNVATQVQIQEWRALRGRFLNALWDAHHAGNDVAAVDDLLEQIDASDLPEHQIDRLVFDLRNDGLIADFGMVVTQDQSVRLTSEGRYEVEQWLAKPDEPTDAIPVPASQVFSIGTMNVTGTVMQGSTAANVNTTVGTSGAELVELVAQIRQILTTANVSPDDREAIEADLEVIEEEAGTPQPRWARLRPFLRRLRGVIEKGALAGIEAGTKQEVIHLIEQAQQLPGISG
jgi:hypothetical protein